MAWCTLVSQQSKEQLFREALQSHCSPRSYLQRQPLNVDSTLFDRLMSKSFLRKFCAIRIQRIHVTLIETSLQATTYFYPDKLLELEEGQKDF